ncbi:MAG: hypothetical protein FJW36_16805 [Acidobacteria bacterium]|nr:hypothetical protein [Acidobacteriota bacterium]
MNWSYDPAALADWLEKQFDEHEELQDKWWRESVQYGKLDPFWQTAASVNRYISDPGLASNRIGSMVTRGFIDVLRLGTGISTEQSTWENFKGSFSNGLRVLAIAGPLMRVVGAAGNSIGLSAASRLKDIAPVRKVAPNGPCAYVATNNVLSYLSGKTVQFFVTLDDILAVRGANAGYGMAELLHVEKVAEALRRFRIKVAPLNLRTVEEAVSKAKAGDSPLLI